MQGTCVYLDCHHQSNLVWYKEYNNHNLFYLHYCNYKYQNGTINIYDYWKIIPDDCIHILFYLPWGDNLQDTINIWSQLAYNKLIHLNKKNKSF